MTDPVGRMVDLLRDERDQLAERVTQLETAIRTHRDTNGQVLQYRRDRALWAVLGELAHEVDR